MALTVQTSSTNEDLSTPQRLRDLLRSTATSEDTLQGDLITRASRAVERYTGRRWMKQGYRETLGGHGSLELMLTATPVLSVSQVLFDDEVITDFTIDDPEAGTLIRNNGWPWTDGVAFQLTGHIVPRSNLKQFQVDYVAGYVMTTATSTADAQSLPEDVEMAVLETAKTWFNGRQDVKSKSVGDLAITYTEGDGGSSLPDTARSLLGPWRRVA